MHRGLRVQADLFHLEVRREQGVVDGRGLLHFEHWCRRLRRGLAPSPQMDDQGKGLPLDGVRQQLVAVVRREDAVAALLDICIILKKGRLADAHDLVSTL